MFAFTDGMAIAQFEVWHEVESSSTNCDRLVSARVSSEYTIGPSGTISAGISGGALGFSAGLFIGNTISVVTGQGTQRAHIHVTRLEDTQPSTQESTRVWAKQECKVWARGTSVVSCGSYAVAYLERWDPSTRSQLACGGDANGDGMQDTVLVVEW